MEDVSSDMKPVEENLPIPDPIVPLNEIVAGGPPKDGIPSIDDPKFYAVAEANEEVDDTTMGMLVKNGKDVKFYPYNILTWHEIVNDTVGGKPLAVTFCPLCGTGIVFERKFDGVTHDFGTSGKLYESNLVMYDRQTESYWSQVLGKAIVGRYTGKELLLHPSSILTYGEAKAEHPTMKVLTRETGHVRDYGLNPYQGYEDNDLIIFPVKNSSAKLPSKTIIYAIEVDGQAKAYEIQKLYDAVNVEDTVNGVKILIKVSDDKEITVTRADTGERIVGYVAMWFSWVTHHMDGLLWGEESNEAPAEEMAETTP